MVSLATVHQLRVDRPAVARMDAAEANRKNARSEKPPERAAFLFWIYAARAVPSGLGHSLLSRHCRAGLSHTAAFAAGFGNAANVA